MPANLLSDLKLSLDRFFFTLDDFYMDASVLDWKRFAEEAASEIEPLLVAIPNTPNWLEALHAYYRKFVDVSLLVSDLDKQNGKIQKQINQKKNRIADLNAQIPLIDAAQQAANAEILKAQAAQKELENELKDLYQEREHLQPLAHKKKYKPLDSDLESLIAQRKSDIAQQSQLIAQAQGRIAECIAQAEQTRAETHQVEQQILADNQAIEENNQRKAYQVASEDFLEEKAAYEHLVKVFSQIYTPTLAESLPFLVDKRLNTKSWRKILMDMLNEPIPFLAGELQAQTDHTQALKRLESNELNYNFAQLVATLTALKKNVFKSETLQSQTDIFYVGLSAGVLVEVKIREKGRVSEIFSPKFLNENGEEKSKLEIFACPASCNAGGGKLPASIAHEIHRNYTIHTCPNLYILFDKYVIELGFVAAGILL
jgi:hypothetical protein